MKVGVWNSLLTTLFGKLNIWVQDIAEALHVFNDGQSLRSSYVNSLPLFLEPVTLAVLEGESGERRRVHRSSTMEDRVLSIIDGIYKNIESTTVSESKVSSVVIFWAQLQKGKAVTDVTTVVKLLTWLVLSIDAIDAIDAIGSIGSTEVYG